MMNEETQLQLQAYLDGELAGAAARRVAEWLDTDREAQRLCAELQRTKALLAQGVVDRVVADSREFYWSRIERAIAAPALPARADSRAWSCRWWFTWAVPAGAIALVACLALFLHPNRPLTQAAATRNTSPPTVALSLPEEIETPMAQASFISFRSEADRMSVVWVDTR